MTFAICNLEKILSTWWKTIGWSVGRWSVTTGQKRDRQDQRRADRSAWRHQAEARRVKAGRSVSRLFDTIMLQSCETPALRRETHHSLFVTSPFAYTSVTRERRPRIRAKRKKKMIISRKTQKLDILDARYSVTHLPVQLLLHESGKAWHPKLVSRNKKIENDIYTFFT